VRRLRKDLQLGTFANLVAKDLQLAIRMESADDRGICQCVTCGKRDDYRKMNAGHFIGSRVQAILLVEDNIHVQCVHCNQHLSGNGAAYVEYMLENYGPEKIEELRALKHSGYKYTREQLADLRDGYKARIKAQEKRLCGR
jgi:hypothetical protein